MNPHNLWPFEQANVDVLCVGLATFDLVLTVDHHPGPDEKCFASGLLTCGGGPAANAAVAVARLGGTSALVGYLGTDIYGNMHAAELAAEGVDTRWVVRRPHPTPLSVILVKPDGDRAVVSHKGQTPHITPEDLDFPGLPGREVAAEPECGSLSAHGSLSTAHLPADCQPKAMLFDGHQPLVSLRLAQAARRRGIPTILDAGSVHRGTLDLLPFTDYLVASAKFAREFCAHLSPRAALDMLGGRVPFAVITLGEQGLIWKSDADGGEMAACQVAAIDTTGAGDTFHGAFALAIANGREFTAALTYASAAAALCCTKLGARPGIPTQKELDAFLRA